MSLKRFTGAEIAISRKAGPKANANQAIAGMLKSGTSAIGKHRDGFASVNDQDYSQSYAQKFGSGAYSVKMVDSLGADIVDGRPIVMEGKIFYPNGRGIYSFFDQTMLDEMADKSDQHEQYVDSIIDRCKTDETLAMLCQVSLLDIKKICKGKSVEFVNLVGAETVDEMADEIANSNAMPSLLTTLHPSTTAFSLGVSKLRFIIKSVLPIISQQSKGYNPELLPAAAPAG